MRVFRIQTSSSSSSLRNISIALVVLCLLWMDTCLYFQIQYIHEDIDNINSAQCNPSKIGPTQTTAPSKTSSDNKVLENDKSSNKLGDPAPSEYFMGNISSDNVKLRIVNKFSFAFQGMSVKLMMTDPVDNYLLAPLSESFVRMVDFKNNFHFITANIVSYAGVVSAIIAGILVSYDNPTMHKLSYIMFQLRTWLDDLDGDVARSRMGIHRHVSLQKTSGYIVDGVCDAIGFIAYIIGCYVLMRKVAERKHREDHLLNGYSLQSVTKIKSTGSHTYVPLQQDEALDHKDSSSQLKPIDPNDCDDCDETEYFNANIYEDDDEADAIISTDVNIDCCTERRSHRFRDSHIKQQQYTTTPSKMKDILHKSLKKIPHLSIYLEKFRMGKKSHYYYIKSKIDIHSGDRMIALLIVCFLLQLAVCATFWNRYILIYQELLESSSENVLQMRLKKKILKSNIMYVIIWFWRLTNGHSLMQMLITAVLFKKLWSFLDFIKYIGFVEMIFLATLTELHTIDVRNLLTDL